MFAGDIRAEGSGRMRSEPHRIVSPSATEVDGLDLPWVTVANLNVVPHDVAVAELPLLDTAVLLRRKSSPISTCINWVCFLALVIVMGTVIYGFWLRAIWAKGYFVAVGVAVLGALVMLIGLAQQAIAARDTATWRDMAEWQIRAARAKIMSSGAFADDLTPQLGDDAAAYYETLIRTMVLHAEDGEK